MRARFRRGLETSIVDNSTAFGFSITVTATFGVLTTLRGNPTIAETMLFVLGAALAFTAVQIVGTRGFRHRPVPDSRDVVLLATAFDFVSIGFGVGAAVVIAYLLAYTIAWPLAACAAATVYIGAGGGELALAELRQERRERVVTR